MRKTNRKLAEVVQFPVEAVAPADAREFDAWSLDEMALKQLRHLANASGKPLTLWPTANFGSKWVGRDAWVTHRREEAADRALALVTILPKHYFSRPVGRLRK